MNNITIFENDNFGKIRMVEEKGEPWFVLADLCKVLELSNPSKVAQRLDEDERSNFKLGRQGYGVVVNESGMYAVILRSDKPQAKPFRKWVTSEVLPSIRKTGNYTVHQTEEIRRRNLEVREMNARSRRAQILVRLATTTSNDTFREALVANAANLAIGANILPLPKLEGRTYTAEEIGKELGISANRVGRLANSHNLKTKEFGEWFADKAKTADKEVHTFRYYHKVIAVLREIISSEVVA
nr:MAG TPA: repressor domain protein [Caudoviricetes sp.]